MRRLALILVCLLPAACTGLEPTALSAGTSVAQSGLTFFDRGKAKAVEMARFPDALAAVRRAAETLSLTASGEEEITDRRARLAFRDDRGSSVVVVVQRRTETITLIQADAGSFGELGLSTLLIKRTLTELEAEKPVESR